MTRNARDYYYMCRIWDFRRWRGGVTVILPGKADSELPCFRIVKRDSWIRFTDEHLWQRVHRSRRIVDRLFKGECLCSNDDSNGTLGEARQRFFWQLAWRCRPMVSPLLIVQPRRSEPRAAQRALWVERRWVPRVAQRSVPLSVTGGTPGAVPLSGLLPVVRLRLTGKMIGTNGYMTIVCLATG